MIDLNKIRLLFLFQIKALFLINIFMLNNFKMYLYSTEKSIKILSFAVSIQGVSRVDLNEISYSSL